MVAWRVEENVEDQIANLRDGVTDADATGMLANEEELAQAEIMAPLRKQLEETPPEEPPRPEQIDGL